MSWFDKISTGLSQVTDYFVKQNTEGVNKTEQNFWTGLLNKYISTPGFNSPNGGLNNAAQRIQLSNEDINTNLQRQAGIQTAAPFKSPQDEPKRGYQSYELIIIVPDNQETVSYEQLEKAVIRDIFNRNNIGYSRASLEEIAEKESIDFSGKYNYEKGVYEYNERDGLWLKAEPRREIIDGRTVKVIRMPISPEMQEVIVKNKALSETIKASGKKTFAELDINERMKMAMQMAYDKHYVPHSVSEAVQNIDPKTMVAGMVVVGGVGYAATKAGASKALPYVGTGVTMAQLTYYYGEADSFLQACKNAKSPEDLDKAAKTFGNLVQQGGVDAILTAATVGAANIGKISKAGGDLVGLIETGVKQTRTKLGKYSEEIVEGMRQTFGDDLTFETGFPINNINDDVAKTTIQESGAVNTTSSSAATRQTITTANLSSVVVPSVRNGEFAIWFNSLTKAEMDALWTSPTLRKTIENRLRYPPGFHEWLPVSRAPRFREWGVTAEQIQVLRTKTKDLEFVNPAGRHGGDESGRVHLEIFRMVDQANNFDEFKVLLQDFARRRLPNGVQDLPVGLQH